MRGTYRCGNFGWGMRACSVRWDIRDNRNIRDSRHSRHSRSSRSNRNSRSSGLGCLQETSSLGG